MEVQQRGVQRLFFHSEFVWQQAEFLNPAEAGETAAMAKTLGD